MLHQMYLLNNMYPTEPCSQHGFLGPAVVVGGLRQSGGGFRVTHHHEQRMELRHNNNGGRDKNGGVAAQGVMVGLFQWKIVRHPKCGKWDKWCKWPGQRQCCWRERFTAGKESDIRHSHKPCCETDCKVTTCGPPLILPTNYWVC